MSLPQRRHCKSLRRLRRPQLRAVRRVRNHALGIHPFDRVRDWRGGDHSTPFLHSPSAAVQQRGLNQTAGSVMNEHVLSIAGKSRQTAFNRFLARCSP